MTDQNDWVRELDDLRAQGEQLQRETRQSQQDMLAMLAIPEQGAVSIEFDGLGLMSALTIDQRTRAALTPEQVVQEINLALIRTSALFGSATATTAENNAATLERVSRVVAAGTPPEPVPYSNDFRTVTVTALWGTVVGVACTTAWISSTPDALIADEIVRMARIAAIDTDVLGRFSNEAGRR